MTPMLKPAWLPDWKDEAAYTDHGDDLEHWAWEFLRRNPEYQADYARWAALPDTEIDEETGNSNHTAKSEEAVADWFLMTYCEPAEGLPANEGEIVGEYEQRTGQIVKTLYTAIPEKWGIFLMEDPALASFHGADYEISEFMPPYSPYDPGSFFDFGPRSGIGMEWARNRCLVMTWPEEIDRHVVTIGFDLRYSIEDQLAEVRKMLSSRNDPDGMPLLTDAETQEPSKIRRKGIPQEKKRLQLLRVLDAEISGATDDEVMAELYEGKALKTRNKTENEDEMQRYKEAFVSWHKEKLRDARELMHGRYKDLLKWHHLPAS